MDQPNDVIDLLVILDRSGSMETKRQDHEGGLRSFVRDQRTLAGDLRLTFIQFDTENACEIVYDRAPLNAVDDTKIALIPRGGTPLLDAMGKAIAHLEGAQRQAPSSQTICMVITDGEENSSKEWTKDQIRARVKACEAKDWTFLFLGADIDAFEEAAKAGIRAATVMQMQSQTAGSAAAAYGTVSNKMAAVRTLRQQGYSTTASAQALANTQADYLKVSEGSAVAFDPASATAAALQNMTDASGGSVPPQPFPTNGPATGGGSAQTTVVQNTSGSSQTTTSEEK